MESVEAEFARAWLRTHDTGTSSETIWTTLTGWPVRACGIPYDPSDFGRCVRLLDHMERWGWRQRLEEVAAAFPAWGPIVANWDVLEAVYREELKRPDGRAPKTHARMEELRDECYAAVGATKTGPGSWTFPRGASV